MPLPITDDHRALAEVARSFLLAGQRAAARALLDAPDEPVPATWKEIAGLGWLGLHVPEEHGGEGAGLPELAVVLEELGRVVAPGPFLPSVLASAILVEAGRPELLPALADGSKIGAVGLAGVEADGRVVDDLVPGGGLADVVLLVVGDDVLVSEQFTATVDRRVLDPTRRAATVVAGVGHPDPGRGGRRAAARPHPGRRRGRGLGGRVPRHGRRLRQAAGAVRPHGRHVPGREAPLRQPARSTPSWPPRPRGTPSAPRAGTPAAELAAAVAAARAVPAGVRAAEMAIQLHGGIGFTWEHDCHLYLRRAVTLAAFVDRAGDAAADTARLVQAGVARTPRPRPARRRPSGTGPKRGRSSPRSTAWTPTARRAAPRRGRLPRAALAAAVGPRRVGRRAARHRAGAARALRRAQPGHHRLEHPDDLPARHRRAGRALGRPDAARRDHVVPAVLRARRRVGRRGDRDPRRARRRRVAGHRAEGVDHRGPPVGLGLRHRAHRPLGAQARGRHDDGDRPAQRRASRCGRCASSPARRCSTRCSSTTCSCPTSAWSARSGRAGGSRGPRSATSGCRSAAAARACCR